MGPRTARSCWLVGGAGSALAEAATGRSSRPSAAGRRGSGRSRAATASAGMPLSDWSSATIPWWTVISASHTDW